MIESTIAAVLGLITSLLATLIFYLFRRQNKHKREERVSTKGKIFVAPRSVKRMRFYGGGEAQPIATPELVKRMEEQILARVQSSPRVSREEVQKEVEVQLSEVQKRIQKIEDRFPEEAKIEKIASINDALLSERIDQLSKQVENIENKMLSHWDVALVVSAIIAAIIAIVGGTYGVLKVVGIIT